MKKLLFVLAFTFFGGQAFSQIYLVTIHDHFDHPGGLCDLDQYTLIKTPPTGVGQTYTCISDQLGSNSISTLNQELNIVVGQGYKLIETSFGRTETIPGSDYVPILSVGTTFIFAIP